MAELSVEDIQEPAPQLEATAPEPEEPAEVPAEVPAEPAEVPAEVPAELPEADVSAEVSIAAPKKRGRPPGSKNKKAQPKRRPREPTPELLEPPEPPPPIDVNALLEPIFKAYMATSEMRKREARQQRYSTLFQGMAG